MKQLIIILVCLLGYSGFTQEVNTGADPDAPKATERFYLRDICQERYVKKGFYAQRDLYSPIDGLHECLRWYVDSLSPYPEFNHTTQMVKDSIVFTEIASKYGAHLPYAITVWEVVPRPIPRIINRVRYEMDRVLRRELSESEENMLLYLLYGYMIKETPLNARQDSIRNEAVKMIQWKRELLLRQQEMIDSARQGLLVDIIYPSRQ